MESSKLPKSAPRTIRVDEEYPSHRCVSIVFIFPSNSHQVQSGHALAREVKVPTFGFGLAALITKEAQRTVRNRRTRPEERQERWSHKARQDQQVGGEAKRTKGRRAGETAKANAERSKCNLRKPEDVIFFRHLLHHKFGTSLSTEFLVGPTLILGRHLSSSHLGRSTKRHRIGSYRRGGRSTTLLSTPPDSPEV